MTRKHYNVVAAVVEVDGKVLCMQRGESRYDYTSHHWEFPGGKIEPGETPEQAVHRELLEEMDYEVEVHETVAYALMDSPLVDRLSSELGVKVGFIIKPGMDPESYSITQRGNGR